MTYFIEEMSDGTYALCEGPRNYDYLDSVRDITNSRDKVAVVVADKMTYTAAQTMLAAAERGELNN